MQAFNLKNMNRGWFIGQFETKAFHSDGCEVAIKEYKKGDYEAEHYHKVSTEVTAIISGRVRMCGKEWGPGDILVLPPLTATDFEALEDTVSTVVKLPATLDDKYLGRPE